MRRHLVKTVKAKSRPSRPRLPSVSSSNGLASFSRVSTAVHEVSNRSVAAMPKLTKRFVDSLRPEETDQVVFDDLVPGFGIRVMPSGVRSYLVQYRNAQRRSRRLTIGKDGALTVDEARDRARKVLAAVRDGRDPAAEKFAFLKAPTVNELLDRYVVEHVTTNEIASTLRLRCAGSSTSTFVQSSAPIRPPG